MINEVPGFSYGFEIQVASTQRNSDLQLPGKLRCLKYCHMGAVLCSSTYGAISAR